MISQKLERLVSKIEVTAATAPQRAAATGLRDSLREAATRQACLRCTKAGFVVIWNTQAKAVEKHNWHVALTSCGAFQSLPQDEGFGYLMPTDAFFCTSEETSPAGGPSVAGIRSLFL